ncbi:MAG: TetR/AcrR family transcriptional regulator [Firmicutes bacterium]|nr:TetR/AcrR family transcriptional regulator [Bacillota bacterium]
MSDESVRRTPQGERGRRRVELILSAAEEELAAAGYDNFTTNGVAARAGISIGSIYQFFPHKEALVQALAERVQSAMRELYDRLFSELTLDLSLPQMVDFLIDPLVAYTAANPAFEILFCSVITPHSIGSAVDTVRAEIVERVRQLFSDKCPDLPSGKRDLYVTVSVQAVEALLPLVSRGDDAHRAEALAEIKRMLIAYLGPVLGS